MIITGEVIYRRGQLTGRVLTTACRFLYARFDRYPVETQARLRREAREILRCGEGADASPDPVHD